VTQDDAEAGNDDNNASWRRVNVLAVNNIDGGGATHREEPAIFAWQDQDRDVEIIHVKNTETGGVKSSFYLGYRVTPAGGGDWTYEYAIQNLNSDQSAMSYSVPVDSETTVTDVGFHDVAYHSGDPYDGTDWAGAKVGGEVRWATQSFATNSNANALRWGTLYNFRFVAAAPPELGTVNLGLFKPGVSSSINVPNVLVPLGEPRVVPTGSKGFGTAGNPTAAGPITPATITIPRLGAMVNPDALSEKTPAFVGGQWQGTVSLAGAQHSVLFFGLGGATEGTFNSMGEVLIRPPVSRGKLDDLTLAIPDDPRLIGVEFSVQAAIKTASGWKLSNALDVTIGSSN
jgi:hypothetical protein